jgi:hypothetical protein
MGMVCACGVSGVHRVNGRLRKWCCQVPSQSDESLEGSTTIAVFKRAELSEVAV